jgi:hypothetical protein
MHLSRRSFLAGCAACAAGVSTTRLGAGATVASAALAASGQPAAKARIRLVFSHIPSEKPTWPNIGYDYDGRKKELTGQLRRGCPDIEFLPATVHNAADAQKVLEADKEVDGYVVYLVGIWTGAAKVIAESGRPVVLVDDLYAGSGEFLIEYARARRAGQKVAGVSSTRFEDVCDAVNCFACINKLRSAKILDAVDRWDPAVQGKAIDEAFGITVQQISNADLIAAFEAADRAEARKWADRWIAQAEKVFEPSREEIEKSAVMYLGMKSLMDQHGAGAITIDCLGMFYAGKMPAYPCLGFWQLNNDGYVGACESDLQSTTTMVVVSTLTGRPGYISDPVIDTSKNQIIYAHCVAPTKVHGPNGPANAYHIRSHSEDRKGACIRSLMPLNEMTTTLEFSAGRREFIIHQGRSVANIDEDKACRTKLAVEVPNARRMLNEWDRWGWHRVTFYGDLKTRIEHLSALLGIKVIEEGAVA